MSLVSSFALAFALRTSAACADLEVYISELFLFVGEVAMAERLLARNLEL